MQNSKVVTLPASSATEAISHSTEVCPLELTVKEEGITIIFEGTDILADVIFVHGLGGSPQRTWTKGRKRSSSPSKSRKSWTSVLKGHVQRQELAVTSDIPKEQNVFWPRDLLPKIINNVRIMTYGYDSKPFRFGKTVNQNTISEHARNMLSGIQRQRQSFPNRPLIFVAHSLGGIITKELLRQSEQAHHQTHLLSVFKSTVGVIFLGCPHRGVNLAQWGVLLGHLSTIAFGSTNQKLLRSLGTDGEMLDVINTAFARYLKDDKFSVHSFSEERGMLGQHGIMGKVVEPFSSVIGDSAEGREGINANHVEMVTFESLEDEGFIKVSSVIARYVSRVVGGLSEEHKECLDSLSFTEATNRHNDIPNPHKDTCKWVLDQNTVGYRNWCENGKGLFWIQGKPGSGKSILLKYLLSEARTHAGLSQSVAGFFFNGRGFPLERCIEGMMRSLLVQLLAQFPASFPPLLKLYKQKLVSRDGGQFSGSIRWSRSELQHALISVVGEISAARRVLLFLDALDECKDHVMDTVEFLQDIINQNILTGANISICVTARPVGPAISNLGFRPALYLEQHTAGDILTYTEARLAFLGTTAEYLKDEIIHKADGVFLWVTLVTEALRMGSVAGDKINELRRMLSSTPSGLTELYRHTLGKIDEQYKLETRKMFQIILAAARPLTLSEFRHILAFESTPSFSAQKEMEVSPSVVQDDDSMEARLLSRCGGLLEVVSKDSDTCQIIQLIHQSVSDFLKGSPTLNSTVDEANPGLNGDLLLLRSCIHYLSISELRDVTIVLQNGNRWTLEREAQETFEEYPLLEYAVKNWTTHWKQTDADQILRIEGLNLAEDLPLQRWIQLYNLCNDDFILHTQDTNLFTIAVESNVCGFVSAIRHQIKLATMNGRFGYPLIAASAMGHLIMVKLLISYGADVNQQGGPLDNALQAAVMMGHDDTVRGLIALSANVNSLGTRYGTALHTAARNNDEDIARILLQNGANVDIVHGSEGSAIHVAASRGLESMVSLLAGSGADLELLDGDGWPPLACAWFYKHHNTIALLSTPSINDSSFDGPIGKTPSRLKIVGGATDISLSEDGLRITSKDKISPAAACSDHCMPIGRCIYYFEVKIVIAIQESMIGIGFCVLGPDLFLGGMPGWTFGSCGYHGDDGGKLNGSGIPLPYGPTYGRGDVVGCGVNFNDNSAFFTKNGQHLGVAFRHIDHVKGKLYAVVGIQEPNVEIEVNFGKHPFIYNPE